MYTFTIQKQRFITLVVWLVSIILSLILYSTVTNMGLIRANAPFDIYVCAFPILAAIVWTGLAWLNRSKNQSHLAEKQAESASIPYKMALLLEMMDEDEREAFKHQLKRDILASETGYGDFDRLALEETEKRKRG
jgi:hypothetical protein